MKTCVLLITVSEKSCVLGGQQILVGVQTFHPNRKICFFLIPKKRNLHLTVELAGSLLAKRVFRSLHGLLSSNGRLKFKPYSSVHGLGCCFARSLSNSSWKVGPKSAKEISSTCHGQDTMRKILKLQAVPNSQAGQCQELQLLWEATFSDALHGLGLFCDTSPSFGRVWAWHQNPRDQTCWNMIERTYCGFIVDSQDTAAGQEPDLMKTVPRCCGLCNSRCIWVPWCMALRFEIVSQ